MARPDLVAQVDGTTQLWVPARGDLDFTVGWDDADGVQVVIADADGDIRSIDTGEKVLDFADYISIVDGDAQVHVPDSVIAGLADWGKGVWSFVATSAGGTVKTLLEGPARQRRGGRN